METFQWMLHKLETQYPESSIKVKFGKSWEFAAPPPAPDQRIFKLFFTGMQYFVNPDGTLDLSTNASTTNVGALEAFYRTYRTYGNFLYNNPVAGLVTVRFNKPLIIPKGVPGGMGLVEDFQVELLEQP